METGISYRRPRFGRPPPGVHSVFQHWSLVKFLSVVVILFGVLVSAECECGYSLGTIGGTAPGQQQQDIFFTDLVESNFARLEHVSQYYTDWAPQAFNLSSERARGNYGEMFAVENVAANPPRVVDGQKQQQPYPAGRGGGGGGDGMELTVKGTIYLGMVPVAEVDTQRMDLSWGTFRASMKISHVPGTCAAFFWYFNDTQEIDMEFLSKDFDPSNNSYPVNLVLQSREAAEAGYKAAETGNFVKAYLPFDPTKDLHEYRIDYMPGRVFFYADGILLAQMNGSAVPSRSPGGHLILQHWSNGNPLWSGGPPREDAVLTVSYVKAYFNSSMPKSRADWVGRCKDPSASGAICAIPNVTRTNKTAMGWFFSDHDEMTNNQTVDDDGKKNGCSSIGGEGVSWFVVAAVAVMTWGWMDDIL
ncbi:glycoside hydrolase, family 16 [Apodospora peruviana]|uniref:Glycoside hydrolase, family 16 n=1 Tax=Apodospora peruviana TaxID=516989 RepID=A0AAE0HWH6_9PEZI|nr:glycoside hydrolase, family 16 [Apodospora peruviana]